MILATLTWNYFPYRRRDGERECAADRLAVLSQVSRFLVEFLRADEMGQFGTSLTISQWVSLFFLAAGLVYWYFLANEGRPHFSNVRHPHVFSAVRTSESTA